MVQAPVGAIPAAAAPARTGRPAYAKRPSHRRARARTLGCEARATARGFLRIRSMQTEAARPLFVASEFLGSSGFLGVPRRSPVRFTPRNPRNSDCGRNSRDESHVA